MKSETSVWRGAIVAWVMPDIQSDLAWFTAGGALQNMGAAGRCVPDLIDSTP